MATAAQNIEILNKYFFAGGDYGPPTDGRGLSRAMWELANEAVYNKATRSLLAQHSILEKTLSPPLLSPNRFVRPYLQETLLERIYKSATGGVWGMPDPSGITEWLGSEAGGRAYFLSSLFSGPRQLPGNGGEVYLASEVLALLLKIAAEVALPASWFQPLLDQDAFTRLRAMVSVGTYTFPERRVLLSLIASAEARVTAELAKLATEQTGAFAGMPAFPTGERLAGGRFATAKTPPPPPRPWYRMGWAWVVAGTSAVAGVWSARRT